MDAHPAADRPTVPADAAAWLAGATSRTVLTVGHSALTEPFAALGHDVRAVSGWLSELPFQDASIDVVVTVQEVPDDLTEVARVLRPHGELAVVWHERDQRIPWVRRLDKLLGTKPLGDSPPDSLVTTHRFGFVDTASYRFWQIVTRVSLEGLVRGMPEVRDLGETPREQKVLDVLSLYDEYGRGADGMQLPWICRCFKASVIDRPAPRTEPLLEPTQPIAIDPAGSGNGPVSSDGSDTDMLLIDFR
jgi:SAM-dependent methyltransferase